MNTFFYYINTPLILIALHGSNLKPAWIRNRRSTETKAMQEQNNLGIAFK